jgi:serine phosphatase RsbU (regulator of sigma subunit)
MKKALLILMLFVYSFIFGQKNKLDSLWCVFNTKSLVDTIRLNAINAILLAQSLDSDSVLLVAHKEITFAKQAQQRKYEAKANMRIGRYYVFKEEYVTAQKYFLIALKILEKIEDKKLLQDCYSALGGCNRMISNYAKASDYYFKALKFALETQDKLDIAFSYNDLGFVYGWQSNQLKALECFHKALQAFKESGVKTWGIGASYNRIGGVYESQNKNAKALEYFFKADSCWKADKDFFRGLSIVYSSIGGVYLKTKHYKKALEYYTKALHNALTFKEKRLIANSLIDLGNFYKETGDDKKSISYSDSALIVSKQMGNLEIQKEAYMNLAFAQQKLGNYKEAYTFQVLHKLIADSIFNSKNSKRLNDLANNYEEEKRAIEQTKIDALKLEENKRQQFIIYAVSAMLLIVFIFSFLLYKRFRLTNKQKRIIEQKSIETETQKNIIEEKNKDITDSITYAKRIQQAKLPRKEEIVAALPHSFVLFKPKDIVSGDFYFFHKSNQSVFIAAADCTGHGVPGAFMSMIGSERLEDAVSNSNDTSQILHLLNKGIKTSLRQSDSDESTRDGMDIAICSVDPFNRTVKYAGANRPIYIIRKGQTQIEEIKATKKAIGGLTDDNQYFETHELQLQQGDTFYISTDGYADQYSGNDKKLTTKKFKNILLDMQDKSMQEQEIYLDAFIEDWKKGIEQIDDILVIGVRL